MHWQTRRKNSFSEPIVHFIREPGRRLCQGLVINEGGSIATFSLLWLEYGGFVRLWVQYLGDIGFHWGWRGRRWPGLKLIASSWRWHRQGGRNATTTEEANERGPDPSAGEPR